MAESDSIFGNLSSVGDEKSCVASCSTSTDNASLMATSSDGDDNGEERVTGGINTNVSENMSLSTDDDDAIREQAEQESAEFAFLKPICAQLLQSPSTENLKMFEVALNEVGKVPVHLSEFVVFPFAIHLKVIKTYKEPERIQIYRSLAILLDKAELCKSYDIFVNIFQKLHISLTNPPNITTVNTQMSETEMEAVVTCIKNVTLNSLSYHLDAFCQPEKVQIFGHSIFLLLQLVAPIAPKSTRLKTLQTLEHFVKLCDNSEFRSKVLYKFLPGVISSLRKICLPSAGNSSKAIILSSLNLMALTIRVSVEFESQKDLEKADEMLSQIVTLISKDFVLNSDADYRKSFFEFCCELTLRKEQLPNCCKSISTILLRMKEDQETTISDGCVEALRKGGMLQNLRFQDLTNLLNSATNSMNSGNDVACILALREISSTLSTIKLSFVEFQTFLPLVFQFMNEMVWKFRSVTVDSRRTSDPIYIASCRVCQNLVLTAELDEVIFQFTSILSDLQSSFNTVKNPTGVIAVFNVVLPTIHELDSTKISDFEAANLAEMYLTLLDMQSSEIARQTIEADIPAVQSAADLRRAYILEGLGLLGETYPSTVIPIILYPLIEHAGASCQNSEIVNEIAESALSRLPADKDLKTFFMENLNLILNEISVRMLNLLLHPNCPHALVFLAQYFDFSNDHFSTLIDQIFERCSDEFGGGNVQHIYVKVFYALLKSISIHFEKKIVSNPKAKEKSTLFQKMLAYQKAIGASLVSLNDVDEDLDNDKMEEAMNENDECQANADASDMEEVLNPVLQLVEKICHRLLNFLPNNNRIVRLTAMDSLILGVQLLANHENSLLPLSHTIWQNLIPRIDEKDYVVVRKSFELLQALCLCSGTFLRKRTIDEAFPKLSLLLWNLAKEGEQVKDKNRQYYTCTQAYKLQLTILQGLGPLLHSIDVQEFELDKIVEGCILYLKPSQHKNLREAATQLLEHISSGKHCRTVWMKLIACGIRKTPEGAPDPSFASLPLFSRSGS